MRSGSDHCFRIRKKFDPLVVQAFSQSANTFETEAYRLCSSLPNSVCLCSRPFFSASTSCRPTQFAKLVELDTRTRAVSEIVVESTVCIEIGVDFREGHGSGTIISKDGLILTAGHVGERSGLDCEITLADGRKLEAVTLGQIFLTQAHRGLDFDIGGTPS